MRARRTLLLALALLGLAGCITPSIPIPPPRADRMVFELDLTSGNATFAYPRDSNYADAIVYVYNRTIGQGVITTASSDGSVAATPPFPADYGNEVSVTIEAEAQTASTCVVLRQSGPVADCNF